MRFKAFGRLSVSGRDTADEIAKERSWDMAGYLAPRFASVLVRRALAEGKGFPAFKRLGTGS